MYGSGRFATTLMNNHWYFIMTMKFPDKQFIRSGS